MTLKLSPRLLWVFCKQRNFCFEITFISELRMRSIIFPYSFSLTVSLAVGLNLNFGSNNVFDIIAADVKDLVGSKNISEKEPPPHQKVAE